MKKIVICLIFALQLFSCNEKPTTPTDAEFRVSVRPELCQPGDTVYLVFQDNSQELYRMYIDSVKPTKTLINNEWQVVVPKGARNGDLRLVFAKSIYYLKSAIKIVNIDSVNTFFVENKDTLIMIYGIGFQYLTEPTIKLTNQTLQILSKTNNTIKLRRQLVGHNTTDSITVKFDAFSITLGIKIDLQITKLSELRVEFGGFYLQRFHDEHYTTFEGGKFSYGSNHFNDTVLVGKQINVNSDGKINSNSVTFSSCVWAMENTNVQIDFNNNGLSIWANYSKTLNYYNKEYDNWNFSLIDLPYDQTNDAITCIVQGSKIKSFLKSLSYSYKYDYLYGSHNETTKNINSTGFEFSDNSYFKITLK